MPLTFAYNHLRIIVIMVYVSHETVKIPFSEIITLK